MDKRAAGMVVLTALFLLLLGPMTAGCTLAGISMGNRVDLRSFQTAGEPSVEDGPVETRDQGSGYTCITFSATAAMEAAYKRQLGLELDLSESFLNYMGKMTWLRYELGPGDYAASRAENQVSAFGGGNGIGWIEALTEGFATPVDPAFPYVPSYDLTAYCPGCQDYRDSFWSMQRNTGDFNLNPANLPISALTSGAYYSVASFERISEITDPDAYEAVLDMGYEIVWDVIMANTGTGVWQGCATGQMNCPRGAHSMLIVGYDNTDGSNPYLLVKNSWGLGSSFDEDGDGVGDGWTRISYDYLANSISAGYITEVAEPRAWPELKFIGRWNASMNGRQGVLDIYHVPGIRDGLLAANGVGATDERLGTFFDEDGNAFRVNGLVNGNSLDFFLNPENPRLRYDELTGTHHVFHLFSQDINAMAGTLREADASAASGGYALRCGADGWPDCNDNYLNSEFDSPRPLEPESWIGRWEVVHDGYRGNLLIRERDDSLAGGASGMAALQGEYTTDGGATRDVVVLIRTSDPRFIEFQVPYGGSTIRLRGLHLEHEPGVAAGESTALPKIGFTMRRLSARLIAQIVQPAERAQSRARQIPFEVEVFSDPAHDCCSYQWTSSLDGALGDTQSFAAWGSEFSSGVHTIRVEVTDAGGNTAFDEVEIEFPENLAPTVTITSPAEGAVFEQSQRINFTGTSVDTDHPPAYRLDEDEVAWYLNSNTSPFGSGHAASLTGLPLGNHTITFRGSDGLATASDTVEVVIIEDAEDLSPSASIIQPANGASYNADTYDPENDQWYVTVNLQGTGTDPEDGTLTGGSLVWTDKVNGGSSVTLGTGTSLSVRLYAPMCFGNTHQITLTVTDSAGNKATAQITVTVSLLC